MRRIAALVLCAIALAATSACSSTSSDPAATVNGVKIPTQDLVDELKAIDANGDYLQTLQANVKGTTPGSFDAAFVAQVLLQQINYSIVHTEFGKRKLTANDECRTKARDQLFQNLGAGNANNGEQLFNKFSQKYRETLERRNTELLALEYSLAELTCGAPVDEAYFKAHPDEFTKLCISLIVVPDQATADTVIAQARGGADFAALARTVSTDEQSKATGGDIGCRLPSEFDPSIAATLQQAATGDVLDGIPGSGGIGIVKITGRQLITLDEARTSSDELATLKVGRSFSTWFQQARADSDITIDSRYGTFDKNGFTINPPTGDTATSSSGASSSSSTEPP